MVYILAKTRERRSKDISNMPFINSFVGQILTVGSEIIQRWLTYVEGLLNTENTRKKIESGLATKGPIDIFNENDVSDQLGKMELANQDIMCVVEAMNQVLQRGIQKTWRKSRMVPIYTKEKEI